MRHFRKNLIKSKLPKNPFNPGKKFGLTANNPGSIVDQFGNPPGCKCNYQRLKAEPKNSLNRNSEGRKCCQNF